MLREPLLSYAMGVLVFLLLYGVAMLGAAHQDSIFGGIGYLIAGVIDLPPIMVYGADGSRRPSRLFTIALYLTEAGIIAIPVYLLFF